MICITGDTHGIMSKPRLSEVNKNLSRADYLIIAGDFGFIWSNKKDDKEKRALDWLTSLNPEILFIDGNHENFDRLQQLPSLDKFEADVGKVAEGLYHLRRGRVYKIEDRSFFTFGGGLSIDKEIRVEGKSWWPQEIPDRQEYEAALENLRRFNYRIDYVVTHAAPGSIKQILLPGKGRRDQTEEYLENIEAMIEYKRWFFGHYHLDKRMGKFRAFYQDYEIM